MMPSQNFVNIGSGNGLVPDGTKPLPEPMVDHLNWDPVVYKSRQIYA